MARFSTSYRNAAVDLFETHVGADPTIVWRTGSAPAALTDADTGTLIGTSSPTGGANWMAASSAGAASLASLPLATVSVAIGVIGYARLKSSGGTVHGQYSVSTIGGGGDCQLTTTNITEIGQQILMTVFSHGVGGA